MKPINRRKLIQTTLASAALSQTACSWGNKNKTPKLGVALVGLGYYSRDLLAPALQLTSHCELRGIVTGTPSKIPTWQKKYGIKDANVYNYENMAQIANNPEIDIVYIVLPTFLHKQYATLAANAGKHVWCEKPMAMTVGECQEIMDACTKNKVKLTIGYRLHHEPNTQTIMQFAQQKPYGPIKNLIVEAGYAGGGQAPDNWRMHQNQGGGALYDMGVYCINGSRYATGLQPISVRAKHIIHRPELFKHADETTEFTLIFPEGIEAKCATSVGQEYNQLVVNAAQGWYNLIPMQTYNKVNGKTSDGKKLNKKQANQQAAQMDNDALAIINNTPVMVPGLEGIKDIQVVEAALKSVKEGTEINIPALFG